MRANLDNWWSEHAPAFPTAMLGSLLLASLLSGVADAAEAPGEGLVEGRRSLVACASPTVELSFDLAPDAAVEWFLSRQIVTPAEYLELDDAARANAFTASRLADRHVLDELFIRLDSAIQQGQTQNDWLTGVEEMLDRMGVAQDPHYLRLIYNQNIATAYSAGRWQQMQSVAEQRPYWQYHSTGDGNERPEHRAFNGIVRRADDTFWERYYPPWDYNCRCWVTTYDDEELAEAGLEVSTASEAGMPVPNEGFGNPAAFFAQQGGAS